MCNPSGGMIDDGTVFRIDQNNFRWVGGCDGSGLWLRQKAEELGLKAWVKKFDRPVGQSSGAGTREP